MKKLIIKTLLTLSLIAIIIPTNSAFAATTTWGFDTPANYTLSSSTKLEVAGGLGKLKKILDPTLVGNYSTLGGAQEVVLSSDSNTAYVALYGYGLQIINISTPATPTLIGSYATPGYARGVAISSDGNTAYVADEGAGLQIIDISTPATPTLIGTYDTPHFAIKVTISSDGNTAYVADGNTGLQIINISTPATPTLIGSYDTLDSARGVAISSDGNTAYVADGNTGLQIINISTPATPTLIGSYDTPGSARGVAISSDGNTAYLADARSGLQIINISTPATPNLEGGYVPGGYITSVATSIDDDIVYITRSSASSMLAIDVSTQSYPTDSPYITQATSKTFTTSVKSFSEIFGTNNAGTTNYQVSTDNGTTWNYWNGTAWTTTIQTDGTQTSPVTDINTNIAALDTDGGDFLWRVYFTSDGNQAVEIDAITITFDDITPPINPIINPVSIGSTTITGSGEDGTTITLDLRNCSNAPVIVVAGAWSCNLNPNDAPKGGDTVIASSTDAGGNISTGTFTLPNPSSKSSSVKYVCKDSKANNYSNFGRHKESMCVYDEAVLILTPSESNPFGGTQCSSELIITDSMKNGDTNGVYSSYNKGVVTQISILQTHINRLLEEEHGVQAAGPIDKWFGSKTKLGVERLQTKLNQLLEGKIVPLDVDGIVGAFTKAAINISC